MHIAEIFVNVKGMFLKGIEKSEDMYASIDMAVDKIERQVVKYKEKLISRKNIENRESMEDLKLSVYDYNEEHAIEEPTVVISKQIPAKPMDIEEAIMQMDLMNKTFLFSAMQKILKLMLYIKETTVKLVLLNHNNMNDISVAENQSHFL